MQFDEISRNKIPERRTRNGSYSGLIICAAAVLMLLCTSLNAASFITNAIYGIFGWYCYAGFICMFVGGAAAALHKRIKINRRYAVLSCLIIFALFTAIHLAFTHAMLRGTGTSFSEYISAGFKKSGRTPGGAIFALPAYALFSVAQLEGSFIILAIMFVICASLITTHIIASVGEKSAAAFVENQFEIQKTDTKMPSESFKKTSKELQATLDAKYQEILQKQSTKRLAAGKSELGLTKPPPKSISGAIYDNPVPLNSLQPDQPSVPEQITQWSTDAAKKLNAGLGQTFGQNTFGQSAAFGQQSAFNQPSVLGQQPSVSFNQSGAFGTGAQQFGQSLHNIQTAPQSFGNFGVPSPSAFSTQPSGFTIPGTAPAVSQNDPNQDRLNRRLERARARLGLSGSLDDRINARGNGISRGGLAPAGEQIRMEEKLPKPYKPRQYIRPPISLIRSESTNLSEFHQEAMEKQKLLDVKLREFGVNAKVTGFTVAPAVTRFEIQLATGTRVAHVEQLSKDISYVLGSTQIRLELVEGKNAIGIEVPNKSVGMVSIKDILVSPEFAHSKSPLSVVVGKNLNDDVVVEDISTMPHLLIAGSTGSGKSVCLNTLLISLLYKAHPDEVKLILVDMKRVELNTYNGGPHMLIPSAIKDLPQVINALKWMEHEMRRRYDVLESSGVNNIGLYHSLPAYQNGTLERMPYIVMVIDEAADLLTRGKKEVEASIQSLSSLARACGIHIILATQRPSVDIITGVIKTNFTVRIAFKVSSRGDSATIIGDSGAEKLVGRGDMLYVKESKSRRVQGAFIELSEARDVMNYIRKNNVAEFDPELENVILNGLPENNGSGGNAAMGFGDADFARGKAGQDPLLISILRWMVREDNVTRTVSISNVQRNFNVGFARAGRIIDQLADAGYVSSGGGTKARNVLVTQYDVEAAYGEQ